MTDKGPYKKYIIYIWIANVQLVYVRLAQARIHQLEKCKILWGEPELSLVRECHSTCRLAEDDIAILTNP